MKLRSAMCSRLYVNFQNLEMDDTCRQLKPQEEKFCSQPLPVIAGLVKVHTVYGTHHPNQIDWE